MKRFLVILLALCLLTAGCKKNEGDRGDLLGTDTAVVYGGVLNLSMADTRTLNPLLARDETVRDGLFAVYEPLIAVTAEQELKPVLAESWEFNDNCTSLTVNLRRDVIWHDGTAFNARDVVYSFNTIKSDESGPYYDQLRYVSSVAELDNYTVNFILTRSYSQLLYSLFFPIIPLNGGDLTQTAVGTGPFMLESYNSGRELSLTRFDGYRDGAAGFDRVVFSLVREDINVASAFSTGVTNAVQGRIFDEYEFAIHDRFDVKRAAGSDFEYLGLNHRRPVFSSATVRSALSAAIDRNALISDGYGDSATAANLPFHPQSLSFTPSKSMTDYNLAAAEESLFYDGWTDSEGDGVLSKESLDMSRLDEDGDLVEDSASGVRLEFSLLVNSENPRRRLAADLIASQLGEVGFRVTVVSADFDDYLSRIRSGDYDAFIGGTEIGNLYDLEFLLSSDGGQNYFGYRSEYMDSALSGLSAATGDAFGNACAAVQDVFIREQPVVGLVFIDETLIMSRDIAGGTTAMFHSPFGNVGKWFFVEQ